MHPGSEVTTHVTVKGGKGDDIINPVSKTFDANGDQTGYKLNAMTNNIEKFYGDEGNDTIWGGWGTVVTNAESIAINGGIGNDKLYGGQSFKQDIIGGSGKDFIRTDYYE